ncbi:hypothetical protein GOODEAATRI_016127 [Goodea atripinnis]|uniref:Uncharacterized protein n=1 Tax=Goodea atripinnis TaxID=208336 RepID=A0ABV0PEJ0_9TELE
MKLSGSPCCRLSPTQTEQLSAQGKSFCCCYSVCTSEGGHVNITMICPPRGQLLRLFISVLCRRNFSSSSSPSDGGRDGSVCDEASGFCLMYFSCAQATAEG